tara:strand:+ start:1877 stop:2407 length:531 start_codon:yes stop_codon:yes gene_type:complete
MLSKRKSNKKKSHKKSGGAAVLLSGLSGLRYLGKYAVTGAATGVGMFAVTPYMQQLTGEDIKEAKKMQLEEDVIKKGDEVINSNDKNNKEQKHTQNLLKIQGTSAILFLAYKIYKKYKQKKSPKKSPKIDEKKSPKKSPKIDDDQKLSISQQIKKLLNSKIFLSIVAALIFYFRKK